MNNMTLRMEIIECLQSHLKEDFKYIHRDETTNIPFSINPEWFTQSV